MIENTSQFFRGWVSGCGLIQGALFPRVGATPHNERTSLLSHGTGQASLVASIRHHKLPLESRRLGIQQIHLPDSMR